MDELSSLEQLRKKLKGAIINAFISHHPLDEQKKHTSTEKGLYSKKIDSILPRLKKV